MRDKDVSWTPEVGLMVNSFSQDAVNDSIRAFLLNWIVYHKQRS